MKDIEAKLKAIRREMWFRGDLRYMTRLGPQRDLYDWIKFERSLGFNLAPFVLNCHRRLGKTFLSALLCWEECLKHPGVYSKLAAPSASQANDILDEHWGVMLNECPDELEPAPFRNEKFTFRNPRWGDRPHLKSILRLYGVKNDRGNKMRGGSTDFACFDECREFQDMEYTWGSVVLPTFKGRRSPFAVFISTPPDSMDHPFVSRYIAAAIDNKRYRCVPASKDPNWTEEEDEVFAREMGGRHSIDYRREIECELVSDTRNLITPEFADNDRYHETGITNRFVIDPEAITRPEYYPVYSVGDMGGAGKAKTDRCGILFSHFDFLRKKLVVTDELFLRDLNTRLIVNLWQEKLAEVYSVDREVAAGRNITKVEVRADCPPQQITDFRSIWNFQVSSTPQQEKESARRYLRSCLNMDMIEISANCRNLINQMRNGTRNPNGDFIRTERLGHCDLISALISIVKICDWEENPYPAVYVPPDEVFVVPEQSGIADAAWGRYYRRGRSRT